MTDLAPGDLVRTTTFNLNSVEPPRRHIRVGEVGRIVRFFLTTDQGVVVEFTAGGVAFTRRDNIRALSPLELLAAEAAEAAQ